MKEHCCDKVKRCCHHLHPLFWVSCRKGVISNTGNERLVLILSTRLTAGKRKYILERKQGNFRFSESSLGKYRLNLCFLSPPSLLFLDSFFYVAPYTTGPSGNWAIYPEKVPFLNLLRKIRWIMLGRWKTSYWTWCFFKEMEAEEHGLWNLVLGTCVIHQGIPYCYQTQVYPCDMGSR